MPSAADTVPSTLPFALALAALAGAVDAIALAGLGDIYVSFMSGNTSQLGVAAGMMAGGHVGKVAAVVLVFVAGVVLGEIAATQIAPRSRSTVLLAAVAVGLGGASALLVLGISPWIVSLVMAFAMGMQNAVVRRAGHVDVALTYVTGTLVHMSRAIAAALLKRGPWHRARPFAALWLAFVFGASAGGLGSTAGTANAIAGTAVVAALLSLVSLRHRRGAAELP